tara:strand:- start:1446 stop:4073 length:2628 start_codon:yes stop_codon:yes gene_type:complete
MAVMNRSMFQRPMPVIRETSPVVKREEGSPMSGETGSQGIFKTIGDFFTKGRNQGDDSTVYDFGEYGGQYDIKDQGFQRVLLNYLPEGSILFSDENNFILSEDGMKAIDLFKQDIAKMQGIKRAEGSPPQGEMVEEQVDVENVGIMDGFKEENPQAVAEKVLVEGEQSRKEVAESDTYDELMQAIRGDNLTEEDRRDELASIVGREDADRTPDSVLTLVQPVMQMMNAETANTGIAQIEDGSMEMPQQPVGVASGGYMSSFPNQNLNTESLSASDNIDDRIMKNLQFENMNRGIMGYAMGGAVQPIQKFSTGDLAESFQSEYLPMYMGLKDYYLPNKDAGVADALMSLSKAGFAYGMGAQPEEAGMLFFDEVGKKGSKRAATEQAVSGQLASGALSAAVQADLAAKKNLSDKLKNTKNISIIKGDNSTSDYLLALKSGFTKVIETDDGPKTTVDMEAFYEVYNPGTKFTYDGSDNLINIDEAADSTKGTTYVVKKEDGKIVNLPDNISAIPNIQTILEGAPEGSTLFLDSNNKLTTTVKPVADKEAYFNKLSEKVEFYSDKEFEDLDSVMRGNLTTVSAGTTFVKMQKGEEVIDVRIEDVGKKISSGYQIVPNSKTSIEKGSVTDVFAQGGSVIKRAEGTPEDGEQGSAYYEGLITDAEDLISKGNLQAAGTEADRSFFNSLYTAAYDGINELLALKQIIAADPSLVGYTGKFQQSFNKIAGVINDLDNIAGDKIFPDDSSTTLGSAMQYVTKPEIAEVKSSVQQLSDAVADIMSLRGKRGTPESVRARAEERTAVTTFEPQDIVFRRIDKLTDFLIDKTKIFGVLSGQFNAETFPKFKDNIEQIRIKIKEINPNNYTGKKTSFSLEELESIVGG